MQVSVRRYLRMFLFQQAIQRESGAPGDVLHQLLRFPENVGIAPLEDIPDVPQPGLIEDHTKCVVDVATAVSTGLDIRHETIRFCARPRW